MNHCRRCDSTYEKPGTCNCFATKAAPAIPVNPTPWGSIELCASCGAVLYSHSVHYCPGGQWYNPTYTRIVWGGNSSAWTTPAPNVQSTRT